jgi:ubiquinone/menaquinone biosynthesis C-methylase UbiE
MEQLLELTEQVQTTHFWFQGFRRFMAPVFASVAAGRTDLRILDCGCGTGHNVPLLQPYGEVYGFDLVLAGLALAKSRTRALVCADTVRVPFADRSFDLVTSFDMLQSVPDEDEALREMARVLEPGGALVFTAAAIDVLRGDHSRAWKEVRRYTRSSARAAVEKAGLRVERVSYLFGTLVPLILTARLAQRATRMFHHASATRTDLGVPAAPLNAALAALLRAEGAIASRVSLPFGSSVLVVARKP